MTILDDLFEAHDRMPGTPLEDIESLKPTKELSDENTKSNEGTERAGRI